MHPTLEEDLLDELHLLVHPVVVGTGRRLLQDGGRHVPLRLLDSRTFTTGVVWLRLASVGSRETPTAQKTDPDSKYPGCRLGAAGRVTPGS